MKKILRMTIPYRPDLESVLDMAVSESVQAVWDAWEWSWRKSVMTFTSASTGLHAFGDVVDTVQEVTYGTNNRVVLALPSGRVNELYDNVSRSDSGIYYFTVYSHDQSGVTIELIPHTAGETVTVRYLKKLSYGDLSAIPEKLHRLVLMGAKAIVRGGEVESSPDFQSALGKAVTRDKPVSVRRWAMGIDGKTRDRIAERNSILTGTSQDVSHPYD